MVVCFDRVRAMPCNNKVMAQLITIKATYLAPFETNRKCGIDRNESCRNLIEVEESFTRFDVGTTTFVKTGKACVSV